MRKVKSRDDLSPKPRPAPAPAAPAPAIDPQLVAMLSSMESMAQNMNAAVALMAKQAEPKPLPAPPAPAPAPSVKRAGLLDALTRAKQAAPPPAPPLPPPELFQGAVHATIERDKKDRLDTVEIDAGRRVCAKAKRDEHGRMQEITMTCDGQTRRASITRNRQDKIEKITLHPANP